MSDLVLARERLVKIADKLKRLGHGDVALDITTICDTLLWRASPRGGKGRAPRKQTVITPEIKARVLELHQKNPTMHIHEIATVCGNLNPGRVSEIINGKR